MAEDTLDQKQKAGHKKERNAVAKIWGGAV